MNNTELLINYTCNAIDITGVPDSMDADYIKNTVITDGKILFCKINNSVKALNFAMKTRYDEYNRIHDAIVCNPVLGSFTFENVTNDILYISPVMKIMHKNGLMSLITTTAEILDNIDTSLNTSVKNTRCVAMCTAPTDNTYKTMQQVVKRAYENGESVIIAQDNIVDNIKVNPLYNSSINTAMQQLTETKQYILAQFGQNIGVPIVQNIKKAQVNSDEMEICSNFTDFNLSSMIDYLNQQITPINKNFGLNIKFVKNKDLEVQCENKSNDG